MRPAPAGPPREQLQPRQYEPNWEATRCCRRAARLGPWSHACPPRPKVFVLTSPPCARPRCLGVGEYGASSERPTATSGGWILPTDITSHEARTRSLTMRPVKDSNERLRPLTPQWRYQAALFNHRRPVSRTAGVPPCSLAHRLARAGVCLLFPRAGPSATAAVPGHPARPQRLGRH